MAGGGNSRGAGIGNSAVNRRVSAHDRLSFPGRARLVDANLTVVVANDVEQLTDLREKLNRKRLDGKKTALADRLGERETSNRAEARSLSQRKAPEEKETSTGTEARSLKGAVCSMCGEACTSLAVHKLLESHRNVARQQREGNYQCNLCAEVFLKQGDYSRHEQSERHRERKERKIQQWKERLESEDLLRELPEFRKEAALSNERRTQQCTEIERRAKFEATVRELPEMASEVRRDAAIQPEVRKRKAEHGVNGDAMKHHVNGYSEKHGVSGDTEKRPRDGQELYSAAAASKRTRVGRKPEEDPGQQRSLADAQTRQQEAAHRTQEEGRRQTLPEPGGSGRVQTAKEEPLYTRIEWSANGDREDERRSGALEREAAENSGLAEGQGRGIAGGKSGTLREDWLDLRLGLPENTDHERSSGPEESRERWVLGEETTGGRRQEVRSEVKREAVAATSNGHAQHSRRLTSAGQERLTNERAASQNGGQRRKATDFEGRLIRGEVPRGLFQAGIDDEGFEVPEEVQAAVEAGADLPKLAGPLNGENYFERMALLYHIEEAQMQLDILQFDQEVTLERSGNPSYLMVFEVPGLSERKPSVAKGNKMYLSRIEARGTREGAPRYLVYAHDVRLESRAIYTQSAYFDAGKKYIVRFTVRREPIVRALRSLQLGRDADLEGFLYPTTIPDHSDSFLAPDIDDFEDKALNTEQQLCVALVLYWTKQVVGRLLMIPPIIIFGPPGTGKTRTMVEAIFQVLITYPKSRILVCAPSNSAADNLLERIPFVRAETDDAIRINSASRPAEGVGALPATLCDFARYNEKTGFYTVPPLSQLSKHRVFVTTCSASYLLAKAGVPRGYFSHIFIDEAGHAVEPECVVPLLNFATRGTIVALAGDHQQLGPVVRSPLAANHGFGVSYLERLCSLPLYSPRDEEGRYVGYQPSIIRKLLRNYRSHPSILAVPSNVFYDGELDACADLESRESVCQWRELPTAGFPIIFHGLETPDDHEEDSPSWYNDGEIRQVRKYLEKLKASRNPRIRENEIGIVAPFRRQVQMLSRSLANFQGRVGTVEDFQGQEMRVIILTTVRAERGPPPAEEPRDIQADLRQGLGFLGNRKRFNVAVTRAKELLIIIGNPHVLKQDPIWAHMLKFCISKGGYQDKDCLPPSIAELKELSEGLADNLASQTLAGCEPTENPAWPEPI